MEWNDNFTWTEENTTLENERGEVIVSPFVAYPNKESHT